MSFICSKWLYCTLYLQYIKIQTISFCRFLGDDCIVLSDALKSRSCLQTIWEKIKDNKPLTDRLLDRSTVASATFLHSIDNPDEILIVGNTHLYFHPDADHIRLLQGGAVIYWLMEILDNMRSKVNAKTTYLLIL